MNRVIIPVVAMLFAIALSSCDVEIDNGGDYGTSGYASTLSDTRWELAEIMDHSNEWQPKSLMPSVDIPELWFTASGSFGMRIQRGSHTQEERLSGTYRVNQGTIVFIGSTRSDHSYSIKIDYLDSKKLEGVLVIEDQPLYEYEADGNGVTITPSFTRYTIRLKRLD